MGLFGKSKKEDASASLFEDKIKCDGCGKMFNKSEMRKCKKCGAVICPVCRETHACQSNSSPEIQPNTETKTDDNTIKRNETLINEYLSLSKSDFENSVSLFTQNPKKSLSYETSGILNLKKAAELGSADAIIKLYEKNKEIYTRYKDVPSNKKPKIANLISYDEISRYTIIAAGNNNSDDIGRVLNSVYFDGDYNILISTSIRGKTDDDIKQLISRLDHYSTRKSFVNFLVEKDKVWAVMELVDGLKYPDNREELDKKIELLIKAINLGENSAKQKLSKTIIDSSQNRSRYNTSTYQLPYCDVVVYIYIKY